jgi:tyrosyl-tRNA synthetase
MSLLLTHDGKKMGKTAQGAVWLDPVKTSPYDFFQFFRNTHDNDVIPVMKRLTFLSLDQINEYKDLSGSALNAAKEKLAVEMTAMVHGAEEAEKALTAARSLFGGTGISADMPSTTVTREQLTGGALTVIDALLITGIAKSKGEARRLIEQGGVEVSDKRVASIAEVIDEAALTSGVVIRKGKKVYHKVVLGEI